MQAYLQARNDSLFWKLKDSTRGVLVQSYQDQVLHAYVLMSPVVLPKLTPKKISKDTIQIESSLKSEFEKIAMHTKDKHHSSLVEEELERDEVENQMNFDKSGDKKARNIKTISAQFKLNLNFNYNEASVTGADLNKLDTITFILKSAKSYKLYYTTHTDSIGSDAFNLDLSQRRAQFIKDYLIKKGIESSRIYGIGRGEHFPIAPNSTPDGKDNPEGRRLNRRTVFVLNKHL
jgi:outer membrane protein OmpA-like peptidoglycan-associated protein